MDILIKESETKLLSNQLLAYMDEFKDEIKKFQEMVEKIESSWQGSEDVKKKVDTMRENYVVEMEKFADIFNEFGTYLSNIPEAYQILDEDFSTKEIGV